MGRFGQREVFPGRAGAGEGAQYRDTDTDTDTRAHARGRRVGASGLRPPQHQRRGLSKTFVAVSDDAPARILGFYALTACEVLSEALPEDLSRKLPRKLPAVRPGRLAVDRSVQGHGLGALLLMDAIDRSRRVLEHIGVHALFVDAKEAAAAGFHRKYGFRALPDDVLTLVLPLAGYL